ncbi:MAG: FKBP-type peptidyl-prolyl cis-trans isomerase [Puniceicoccales bacterium]|jgi:FKBP-type peptidyl-prolyl cis-trans isomerase|nr:FKBP-type peptidyl-prolyl cis-trans isomerase [Puniceicoccales bacterium]
MKKKLAILVSLLCGSEAVFSAETLPGAPTEKDHQKEVASVATPGQEVKEATQPQPKVYTQEQIRKHLELFGCLIGKQVGVGELYLSAEEFEYVVKGFKQSQSEQNVCSSAGPDVVKEAMQCLQERMESQRQRVAKENKEKEEAYFKGLDKDSSIKKTESGLRYKITKAGESEHPTREHEVTVHYVGKLSNGTEFDSSKKQNEPAKIPVAQVIPGFSEGVQLIGKGGSATFYIPSNLAYGEQGVPGIPPGSSLIFEVELIDFKEAPKEQMPQFDLEQLKTELEKMKAENINAEQGDAVDMTQGEDFFEDTMGEEE